MAKRGAPTAARNWRDATLFLTGLGLTIHEVVVREGVERPTVLILLAGMMGLPAFIRRDEKKQPESEPEDSPA